MKIDLTNKRAVITGSTAGIGFAIACGLANVGASVVLNGRKQATVDYARKRLLERLPQAKVEGVAADLSQADGVDILTRSVPEVDILVNNMGIFEPKPFDARLQDSSLSLRRSRASPKGRWRRSSSPRIAQPRCRRPSR